MSSTPKEDREHLRRLQRYRRAVDRIFTAAAKDAAAIGRNLKGVNPDKVFSFSDYPQAKKAADALIKQLREDLAATIEGAVEAEWALANSKNDRIVKGAYGAERWAALSAGRQAELTQANAAALQSFKSRQVAGLNLSERVWKYSSRFRDEIELGLDCGIRDGLSAAEMARQLKQYLQEPDNLFRRVRNEHGNLVLSQRAAAYHPGRGVYRSSYKNALRLAATEGNMAYRAADNERWKQLDFVVGIEIRLSNNHTLNGQPFTDICDELAGRYPKEFKFTGWHPLCRCFAVSILKTEEEIERDERLIREGKEPSSESVMRVDDVPEAFKAWLEANRGRIEGAENLPYFIRDNKELVDGILNPQGSTLERAAARHAARTPEAAADIKARWEERRMGRTPDGVVFTEEQLSNFAALEKSLGLKRGYPMTYEEANMGSENPNFASGGGYRLNCQTCTMVHLLRRFGFNLRALPNVAGSAFRYMSARGFTWEQRFLNGNGSDIVLDYTHEWVARGNKLTKRTHLRNYFAAKMVRDGLYEVYCQWARSSSAHVFLAEVKNGVVRWFDPQTGAQDVARYINSMNMQRVYAVRIDDKIVNPKAVGLFGK